MKLVSGIQPTGVPHLGNYLGAIQNWVSLQNGNVCHFFLADLHALSTNPAPATLHRNVMDMAAMLYACGVEENNLFVQSMVPEHTELQWMLTTVARMGWLNRMTQFKDRSDDPEGVGVGVFAYPILQAADVLLYNATHVPVGDDQGQHLQLVRDIAQRFNNLYGDVFLLPEAIMSATPRVMSLKNGIKKMSKSDEDPMSRIDLNDADDVIVKKYRRAVTDTDVLPSEIAGLEGRRNVENLVTVLAALVGDPVESVLSELGGQGHGVLKQRLADATIAVVAPIRARYGELRGSNEVKGFLRSGARESQIIAGMKMIEVRETLFNHTFFEGDQW